MARFTQYRVFAAAVETGSISQAAERLNLTPGAVSKQISALESQLGVQLFERSNRNITVTSPGQQFYQRCRQILQEVTNAEDELKAAQGALTGTLRLTLSKSLLRSEIFRHLAQFSIAFPEVRFDLRISEAVEDLHTNNLDFAFRIGQLPDHSRLVAIPLCQVRPLFCATPGYLEQRGCPQDYSELHKHTLVLLPAEQLSDQVRQFFKRQHIDFNGREQHRVDDIEAGYQMMMAGMGIGMMLDCAVQNELREGTLQGLFQQTPAPAKTLYLIYRKSAYQQLKQQSFKTFIRQAFNIE